MSRGPTAAASVVCPHRPPCPGCPRLGAPGIAPHAFETLRALAADAGLPPPVVVEGEARGHRHRARLAVRGRARSPKVGLFQADSHRIVDVPRCLVHHPLVNDVAAAVRDAVRATDTAPYADAPHRGLLRYVQVVVERATQTAQVVLVGNDTEPASLAPLADALAGRLGARLHSLWWNGNPERTNVILGPHWHRWRGPEAIVETIGGARVVFPPGAFGQTNLPLADRVVAQVQDWVPDDARVLELYAGCGAIGLGLVSRVAAIAFNEVAPASLDGLRRGLALAGGPAHATVLPGPAAEHASRAREADVVIVDPPRKGLDPATLDALCAARPARLVVVSCGLEAFVREAEALRVRGRMRLRALVPFALFPWTEHVETVARFEPDEAP
jgi:23S rRNA (uracil1939-C5)-methyltransferase